MRIYFLRHAMTAGNLEKRYIGRTDEPLCREGTEQLASVSIPRCELLVCSPMKRCTETAALLFPGQEPVICEELRECDFGDFEGKYYPELNGDERYQKWIDSGGTLPFPNGESPDGFRERCCGGFMRIMERYREVESAAFVIHGGTIMSLLSRFAVPHRDYFDWQCKNAHGYRCEYDGEKLTDTEKI